MHVGLIGGIGPAATWLYYRGLVAAFQDSGAPMDLTIVHAEASDLVRNFTEGNATGQAEIFAALIQRLKDAGAAQAAVTSLGGHFCIEELKAISPLALIDAIPTIDTGLASRGLKRVGLLGTRRVMSTGIYGGLTTVDWVAPEGDELEAVHASYVAMAIPGVVTEEQRAHLFAAGRALCEKQGAEAVVLAGTDLFLAFEDHDPGYPVIDSADIHIAAIAAQLAV
jgi:aspartate racemase